MKITSLCIRRRDTHKGLELAHQPWTAKCLLCISQRHQRVPFNQDKMPGNRLEAIWLKQHWIPPHLFWRRTAGMQRSLHTSLPQTHIRGKATTTGANMLSKIVRKEAKRKNADPMMFGMTEWKQVCWVPTTPPFTSKIMMLSFTASLPCWAQSQLHCLVNRRDARWSQTRESEPPFGLLV